MNLLHLLQIIFHASTPVMRTRLGRNFPNGNEEALQFACSSSAFCFVWSVDAMHGSLISKLLAATNSCSSALYWPRGYWMRRPDGSTSQVGQCTSPMHWRHDSYCCGWQNQHKPTDTRKHFCELHKLVINRKSACTFVISIKLCCLVLVSAMLDYMFDWTVGMWSVFRYGFVLS